MKRCTEILPSVPRTLAESARESDGRSRRGLNFVTIQTKMQSLPGKEVNNFMFDSVLADLFFSYVSTFPDISLPLPSCGYFF